MNWKKVIAVTLLAGLAGGGYALYRFFQKQSKLLQDYQADLTSIKFTSFSKDLVTMVVTFRITNKSAIEANVKKLYADVTVNNAYVGFISTDSTFAIPAHGTSDDIQLRLTISNKDVLSNIVGVFFSLATIKDIPYGIKGSVTISSLIVTKDINFDYNGFLKNDMLGTAVPIST